MDRCTTSRPLGMGDGQDKTHRGREDAISVLFLSLERCSRRGWSLRTRQ